MNLGILGAGRIAVLMADTIRKLNDSGDHTVKLYAVAARDLGRAQTFAMENGVERAFGSYEEMLRDPELDFVYIATPHSHHYQQIKLCADHGKHVLCEKAFTVNARQAQEALSYARAVSYTHLSQISRIFRATCFRSSRMPPSWRPRAMFSAAENTSTSLKCW